jgi:hypothetical protein
LFKELFCIINFNQTNSKFKKNFALRTFLLTKNYRTDSAFLAFAALAATLAAKSRTLRPRYEPQFMQIE